ncbi:hypothetical protein PENSPDRAFT_681708 [Peniophora sp. CONT]|nr:hypothetical protein PENSPDRAFT_681708 [Peniophora sp. CONT]
MDFFKRVVRYIPTPLDNLVPALDLTGKGLGFFAENDVVPRAAISTNDPLRAVTIGCHPAGVGLGEIAKDALEKAEKEAGRNYLDPTYHWAVMVGDYYHELNPKGLSGGFLYMEIQNGYQNGRIDDGKVWTHQVQVGFTKYNDAAIVAAGKAAIAAMPKAYNLFSNNCQNLVIDLIKVISPDPNMSGIITLAQVVSHIEKNTTDSEETTQEQIALVKARNVPATSAAAIMESVTPTKVVQI